MGCLFKGGGLTTAYGSNRVTDNIEVLMLEGETHSGLITPVFMLTVTRATFATVRFINPSYEFYLPFIANE